VRRALAPADYAGGTVDVQRGIAANAEVPVKVFIDASATAQAGYRCTCFTLSETSDRRARGVAPHWGLLIVFENSGLATSRAATHEFWAISMHASARMMLCSKTNRPHGDVDAPLWQQSRPHRTALVQNAGEPTPHRAKSPSSQRVRPVQDMA
jgi:hypothetical protein